jgi:hypothetical protein
MNFENYKNKPVSEKVVIALIQCNENLKGFNVYDGSIYKKELDFNPIKVYSSNSELSKASSIASISSNKWFYESTEKTLYIDSDLSNVKIKYELPFSTGDFILPYDLDSGFDIPFEGRLSGTSSFGHDLDSEQMGTALQGQGSLSLLNSDGYFDEIFDRMNFENQMVKIYSWSPRIPINQAKLIYKGFIKGKSFSISSVSFDLYDFMAKLEYDLAIPKFDGTEGDYPDSQIGTYKRRIYGRVAGLKVAPLDNILTGYTGSGTISGEANQKNLIGVGTFFLAECSPDDDILIGEKTYKIESITGNNNLIVSSKLEENVPNSAFKVSPKINYRLKNRKWLIAHHDLKKIQCQITNVIANNRVEVNTIEDFYAGDLVIINGEQSTIRRLSGNLIVLEANLNSTPSVGDTAYKYPIQDVKESLKSYVVFRDYDLVNEFFGSCIEFNPLAEFNITREFPFIGSATFTDTSRIVTGTDTSFDTDFSSRDWIKPSSTSMWYEILSIDSPTQITLRIPFSDTTTTETGVKKNVKYFQDDSIILLDCYGKTEDGTEDGVWIKTAPQVIKDALKDVSLDSEINIDSFSKNTALISLKVPLKESVMSCKDLIDSVNKSVLGSLFNNDSFEIEFSLIEANKPQNMLKLKDDDIISWEVANDNSNLVSEFICAYKHIDIDVTSMKESSYYKSHVNSFTENYLEVNRSRVENVYLYNEDDAGAICQRYALINSQGKTQISISSKLNLINTQLNDKITVNFNRLFKGKTTQLNYKTAIVNSVKKSGTSVNVNLDDLGNIWGKAFNLSENDVNYSSATDEEKVLNGFLTDSDGLVLGLDFTDKANIIT